MQIKNEFLVELKNHVLLILYNLCLHIPINICIILKRIHLFFQKKYIDFVEL